MIKTTIEQRDAGVVAFIVFDRAEKANALNSAMMEQFVTILRDLSARGDVRAIVLRGAGDRAFIGGADIAEMACLNPVSAKNFIAQVHACCDVVRRAPAPVIAVMTGVCFGAGMELAACCDIRLASEDARFGMPEARLGVPSVVEAAVLPGLIGWARTRALLLLGETISAVTAENWGFLHSVTPQADLPARLESALDALFACGPHALRRQKALMLKWENQPLDQAIAAGIDSFSSAFETDEPHAMMGAFLAERAARRQASRS